MRVTDTPTPSPHRVASPRVIFLSPPRSEGCGKYTTTRLQPTCVCVCRRDKTRTHTRREGLLFDTNKPSQHYTTSLILATTFLHPPLPHPSQAALSSYLRKDEYLCSRGWIYVCSRMVASMLRFSLLTPPPTFLTPSHSCRSYARIRFNTMDHP